MFDSKGEWIDADVRMFRACFAILGEFVEQELGPAKASASESEKHRGYRVHFEGGEHQKAIDLWLWYRDELPGLGPPDETQEIQNERFAELMKIRNSLWT